MQEEKMIQAEWQGWVRKTAFFLTGQAVSLFGSALVQYAKALQVLLIITGISMEIVSMFINRNKAIRDS